MSSKDSEISVTNMSYEQPPKQNREQLIAPQNQPDRYMSSQYKMPLKPQFQKIKAQINDSVDSVNLAPRVALINKRDWIPDVSAAHCTNCYKEFGFFFRKHHCRICGQVYCKNCSTTKFLDFQNEKKNMRVCTKCDQMHYKFQEDLNSHKPLLAGNHNEQTTFSIKGHPVGGRGNGGNESQYADNEDSKKDSANQVLNTDFSSKFESSDINLSQFNTSNNYQYNGINNTLANNSNTRETQVAGISNQFGRDTMNIKRLMSVFNLENQAMEQSKNMSFQQQKVSSKLEKYLAEHLKQIAETVLDEFKIDQEKWSSILQNYMETAVKNIRPSSKLLGDSIDITKYIKIYLLEWKNQEKCQYINGVVLNKNVAHKRMATQIKNPRILLITNSLGYLREEEGFMDLESVIRQEEPYVQIIMSKIQKVRPDLIIVEKDVSRLALDTLMQNEKTVVTNVKSSIIKKIARCTQTIACPSTNLIDENFVTGNCEQFRIEKLVERKRGPQQMIANETSLMYIEGCQPFIGCTIILSGSEMEELKVVKKALQKMIKIARILILESEYYLFSEVDIKTMFIADERKSRKVTPFLLSKHLERNFLVFELVYFSKKQHLDEDDLENQEGQVNYMNESKVKRKLNVICQKPQKLLISFYSHNEDTTLGSKIRELGLSSVKTCPSCKQINSKHIICYYHNDGYVEIKMKADVKSGNDIESITQDIINQTDIFMEIYCNQCKKVVMKRTKLPSQVYEFSFHKYLEQFFYNQNLKKLVQLEQDYHCNHFIHQKCSMIFKIGPVKIMFNYLPTEVYSIDLIHYQQLENIQVVAKNLSIIKDARDNLLTNFTTTIQYIDEQCRHLKKNVKQILQNKQMLPTQQIQENLETIKAFIKELKLQNMGLKEDTLTTFSEVDFDTILQVNRVHKTLTTQISHFIVILREVCNLIYNELFPRYGNNKQNNTAAGQGLMIGSMEARNISFEDMMFNYKGNLNSKIPTSDEKQQRRIQTITLSNTIDNNQQMLNTSGNASLQDVFNYEFKFQEQENLRELFMESPSIPLGYNKNGVQVNPDDYSSIIAFALSSNLYIEGLIKINYMDLGSKVTNVSGASQQDRNQKMGSDDFMVSMNEKLKLAEKNDILNKETTNQEIENELLSTDAVTFSFYFSNYGPPKNCSLKIQRNGQVVAELKNGKQIYTETQQVAEMKMVEKEFPRQCYEQLGQIRRDIQTQKTNIKSPPKGPPGRASEFVQAKVLYHEQIHTLRNEIYDIQGHFYDKIDFSVKVYFPGQFEALRKLYCGSYESFIHSIFRSNFWHDNTGGKSKSKFFKSSDEKFVFKMVKSGEIKTFKDIGLGYFDYMCKSFFHHCPTSLAKTLGAFKVKLRYANTGKSSRFCFIVLENILININDENCMKYDLKGSRKKRFISNKQKGQVLLDNNFLYDHQSKPIVLNYAMKRLFQAAINNDTFFLAKNNIVDYSLLAIIDKERKLLRVGIIDYIQQYTIDKILESRFKKVINAGENPTIIDPDPYKKRFKDAMNKYFIAIYSDQTLQNFADIIPPAPKAIETIGQ